VKRKEEEKKKGRKAKEEGKGAAFPLNPNIYAPDKSPLARDRFALKAVYTTQGKTAGTLYRNKISVSARACSALGKSRAGWLAGL
jgi:hypothetical protein